MKPLTYYLLNAFGPKELEEPGALMDPESHGLGISEEGAAPKAVLLALSAANASYSPYTNDYSGVAVVGPNSDIYVGRYAENAAYNPSMSPIESALASMNMKLPPPKQMQILKSKKPSLSRIIKRKLVKKMQQMQCCLL